MTAATTTIVYEALAAQIRDAGIEAVFGLMSDDTALLIATLDALGVRFYGARHENMAIAMAEGYASATRRLGVALIGRGPGTANGFNAAMYAQRSGSPVLLILGAAATNTAADLKDLNTPAVLAAAGLRAVVASDADAVCANFVDAASLARDTGCVALLVPADVLRRPLAAPMRPLALAAPPPALAAAKEELEAAVAVLAEARRPLIVAGHGAHLAGAREAIIELAERTGAVLATTLKAKDMFRGHPYNVGIVGSFSQRHGRRFIEEADCVMALGAGMNTRTTANGTALPRGPVIHVDRERAHIGRWLATDVAVVADVRLAAEQLLALLPARDEAERPFHTKDTRDWLADANPADEFQIANTSRTMDPRALAMELDRLLPRERNVVYDAGNFVQVEPLISVPGPACLKNSWDFSSIGMGFGTALGFAAGAPQRPTVFMVGDGGFLMTLGELETTVRENLPLVIVVMNDCAYGAELHYLKERDMPVATAAFPDVDFAPVAAAFGFEAHTVRTLDELRALAPLLAVPEGPILLDCKINASVGAPFVLEAAARERAMRQSPRS
ncbi:thiamine pyrophosphate-binding protein [Ramlibacter sp.]|uniref:thiamine pyrophosphate-binding protein n=1 Tax=Ramlibacter sp. TaxID=1917967 RepID=UPI003D0E6072